MIYIYLIADFKVKFIHKYSNLSTICSPYSIDSNYPDIIINISNMDIEFERINTPQPHQKTFYESTAAYRKLAEWLPTHGAWVFHSSLLDIDGVGVAFAAHSGTGKTTHMRLWQELLGERMVVVNGDKPIVRFFDDEPECPYAYGTPWNGKEGLGCNMRTPLKHICFIERSLTNSCEPIDKNDALNRIFKQVYMPTDPQAAMCTMQLIDRLLSSCKLWKIKCNMEPQAAEVAYNTIFAE